MVWWFKRRFVDGTRRRTTLDVRTLVVILFAAIILVVWLKETLHGLIDYIKTIAEDR